MRTLNPLGICKEEVMTSLAKVLAGLGYDDVKITLDTPPENLGDIAFSCFSLAPLAKKTPQKIAEEIADKISFGEIIEKCESSGPYVNFHFNSKKLAEMTLKGVLELGDDYGCLPQVDRKIILEHTSANPTDKLHIGRARNPIIGDSLARILRKAGFTVETQYYVDDMGKQAVTLAYGIEIWDKRPADDDSLGPYQYASKAVSENKEMETTRDDWLKKLEKGEPEITDKVRSACARVMDEDIFLSLSRINVAVDKYVYESQFVLDGSVDKVIAGLKESQHCDEEEGAYFIDLMPFRERKEEGKFFFQRSDGTSLYATRDIAYHLWKYEHCDDAINILGEDHKLESEYVAVGLKIMGLEKAPEVIFYSFVSLPEGRMSTRKGKVVFVEDLIDEAIERAKAEVKKRREELSEEKVREIAEKVAIGAIRFNIARVQAEKKIVFKWEDALNFEGASAPFIQYSHARASSILRKAKEAGIEGYENYDPTLSEHPSEISLVKEMASFPETVKECAERRSPHTMAAHAYACATIFNQFYRDCPVLACEDDALRKMRLALVDAGRIVLKNSLFCLGIEAPDEM
ncbi:MAG: arginine--tRNA ligase [Thermoplasmata archaeon]|nr:MAG: arginine--tRNA ligase [Thermoplasmata archaeon]